MKPAYIVAGVAVVGVLAYFWMRKTGAAPGPALDVRNDAAGPRLPALPKLPKLTMPTVSGAVPNMPSMPSMPSMQDLMAGRAPW